MKIKNNVPLSKVSWLSNSYDGIGCVRNFFLPENLDELFELIIRFYENKERYLIAGHTSNMYFMPDYICDNMISTKLLDKYSVCGNMLICECGVKVSTLAKKLVDQGFSGFEGLVDLPGTIGGGLYGNAGCYSCHVADNLVKVDILNCSGKMITLSKEDLHYSVRSSIFKRKEMHGIIIRAYFKLEKGNNEQLKRIAAKNHEDRKKTQPGPAHNLGSIYAQEEPTSLFYLVRALSHLYGIAIRAMGKNDIETKRKNFELVLMGGQKLIPYVDSWNRFIWKDKHAHEMFWKYDTIHSKLFKNSKFEIEIYWK